MKVSGTVRLFVLLLFLPWSCEESQEEELHVPDTAFFQALLDKGVDRNGDGRISPEEAAATDSLHFAPLGIADLTGLEAFTRLRYLSLNLNPLSGLELQANTRLEVLHCENCQLSSLDLTPLAQLKEVRCGRNHLTSLDVSHNAKLQSLACNNNLLSQLDLTNNLDLLRMISCGNLLSYLDVHHLKGLQVLGIDNMPLLEEVCVWTLPFPPQGVKVLMDYSPNVAFTTACDGT